MSTSLQSEGTGSRVILRWLLVVRTVALCSLLAILVPWYAAIFRDFSRQDPFDLLWPILFCPLWLPYVWVFWGLRSNGGAHSVKKALAVAFGCGSLILVLFSLLLAVTSFVVDRQMSIVYALVVLLQIALLFGAVRAYYSMDREHGDLRILATRLWIPVVGIAAAVIILPNVLLRERPHYEASSVGSLRTINVAQVEYARAHPDRGFADSLAELGPGSGDSLIDSVLASGKKSSYVFTLTAAPPDSHGRIIRYTVLAGRNITARTPCIASLLTNREFSGSPLKTVLPPPKIPHSSRPKPIPPNTTASVGRLHTKHSGPWQKCSKVSPA